NKKGLCHAATPGLRELLRRMPATPIRGRRRLNGDAVFAPRAPAAAQSRARLLLPRPPRRLRRDLRLAGAPLRPDAARLPPAGRGPRPARRRRRGALVQRRTHAAVVAAASRRGSASPTRHGLHGRFRRVPRPALATRIPPLRLGLSPRRRG